MALLRDITARCDGMSAVIGRAGSWPRRWGFLLAAVGIATAATPLLAAIPHITDPDALPPSTPALVGFSFSPIAAIALGEDPLSSLQQLLHELHADLVRLPANWREMGAQQGSLDFTGLDQLLATVSGYNRQEHAHARVVMVVGARNLSYPEVYVPDRMSADKRLPLPQLERSPDYRQYLSETFRRYAASSLLYAWQLENEPLDKVTTAAAGNPAL